MSKRETRFNFTQCIYCKEHAHEHGDGFVCLAWELKPAEDSTLEKLIDCIPFSQWKTPTNIADTYNYSSKQVIRLVSEEKNRIAALNIQGRWFILSCSFAYHLQTTSKINLQLPAEDRSED